VGRATPASAIRDGNLKLLEFFEDGGHVELYDLAADPTEEHDLATDRPAAAKALAQALRDWQRATGAALPTQANPAYDAEAKRPRGRQGGARL
jgi:arylsulfatase A-like enzyme